jgi:hypothetical protein
LEIWIRAKKIPERGFSMEDKNERNGRLRREVRATSYYWPDGDGIDMCPKPLSAAIGML